MIISADVSKYQVQVNNAYTRPWLIIRCCDGDTFDVNAVGNADWCRGAVAQGLMLGWTAYVVYRPGMNAAVLSHLAQITPLDRVMIDIEAWGGQITGNHAAEINSLATSIGHIVGPMHVWVYGNAGDLNSIDPGRTQLTVVAAYGNTKPSLPNMIGWQYTNGQISSGGRPLSSPPFGACDHNELYVDQLDPSGGGILVTGPTDASIYNDVVGADNAALLPSIQEGVLDARQILANLATLQGDVNALATAIAGIESAISSITGSGGSAPTAQQNADATVAELASKLGAS